MTENEIQAAYGLLKPAEHEDKLGATTMKKDVVYNKAFQYSAKNAIEPTFSEGLTKYAAEYAATGVLDELNFIAPPVEITSKVFEYRTFGSGTLFVDDERARYGEFEKVQYPAGEMQIKSAINRGLQVFVDNQEGTAVSDESVVRRLMRRLIRGELFRAYQLAIKIAVSTTESEWSDSKSKPDSDLRKLLLSSVDSCGVRANRIVSSGSAWAIRAERYEDSPASALSAQQVSDKLEIERLLVSKEYYSAVANGKKISLPMLPDGVVLAFYGEDDVSDCDFSSLKRFCTDFKVHREEVAKGRLISVEHYSRLAATGAGSVAVLKIS